MWQHPRMARWTDFTAAKSDPAVVSAALVNIAINGTACTPKHAARYLPDPDLTMHCYGHVDTTTTPPTISTSGSINCTDPTRYTAAELFAIAQRSCSACTRQPQARR